MNTNQPKILFFEICSLIFCLIFAFINHFLFERSNKKASSTHLFRTFSNVFKLKNPSVFGDKFLRYKKLILAPFVPVNESVWEHGKLLFMPFLFFAVFESFFINNGNFIFAKSLSLVLCVPLMIIIFYTYTGIIGRNFLLADISLAVLIVIFMNILSYNLIISDKTFTGYPIFNVVIIYFISFILFTFYPPKIALFLDTTTNTYGIS